jgi:hypothetical protein
MEAALAYAFSSEVVLEGGATTLRLSPNLRRDPTYLVARLAHPLEFRDALLALHDVARSELFVSAPEIERRVLDPVVTVTAREVYFEAFSLDESTYGRVTVRAAALADVEHGGPGTTNVQFSRRLVQGLETLRSGSRVGLHVHRQGLTLAAGAERIDEQKIDLPDSWAHGFLSVAAAVSQPAVRVTFHPGDLRNVVTYLKGRKETVSPRSLRFRLRPKATPSVVVEPWNETIELGRSTHDAAEEREIRVWGRRRLILLQKMLPGAKAVAATLQGSGRPSFWRIERGPIALTLGLSPWTERDWAGLDPLPLATAEGETAASAERAALVLEDKRCVRVSSVAAALACGEGAARAALDRLCREGRALFDPEEESYVARRIFVDAPPAPPASAERESAARAIVGRGGVTVVESRAASAGGRMVTARVKGNGTYDVTAVLDEGGRLARGVCACPFFSRMGLERGACKHLLALGQVLSPSS